MSAVLAPVSDRASWLATRRTGIGGSDVAAILGLSKWRTPLQVYREKRGEAGESPDNPAMAWGRRLEPAVLSAYADETRVEVLKPEGIIAHPDHDFLLASLDGFTNEPRVVEVKTARAAFGWGEPGTAEVPDDYALQVQHYMAVTGFALADVAVLIGGSDFRVYTVPFDASLYWDSIFPRLRAFWQAVQAAEAPPAVTYADAVQKFGRSASSGSVMASSEVESAWADLHRLKAQRESLEAQEEACKAAILSALGEHGDTLIDPRGRTLATWKLAKAPERFDSGLFKATHPDLYPRFVKTGEASRRLLIKEPSA